MDWQEIMGQQPVQGIDLTQGQAVPPVDNGAFSAMMTPQPDIQQYRRPATNPGELKDRMTIWAQLAHKFQTDPNLQRSLMLAGASLAQPIQPGQSGAGHIANAAVVGTNAYQMGQQADFARQIQMGRENREERRENRADIESADRLEENRGLRPLRKRVMGAQATSAETDADVKVATKEDAILAARVARQRAERLMEREGNEEAVAEVERRVRAVKGFAALNVSPDQYTEAALNDLKKTEELLASAKLERNLKGIQIKKGEIDLATATAIGKAFEKLSPEDQLAFATKTGRFDSSKSAAGSALEKQAEVYGKLYDSLPETDPARKEAKAQFVMRALREAKHSDAIKQYIDAARYLEPEDLQALGLRESAIEAAKNRRGGAAAAPAAAPAADSKKGGDRKKAPIKITSDAEFDALPPDTLFVGPDGKLRRKPK